MAARGQPLAEAALLGLVIVLFFSVALESLLVGLAWLGVLLASLDRNGGSRGLPTGLVVGLAAFVGVSAVAAWAGVTPASGGKIVAREVLSLGAALAAARIHRVERLRLILLAFLAMAAVAGLVAVYQWIWEFDWQISFSHRAHGFWHRAAFFSYANVMAMAFAVALGLLASGRGPGRRLAAVAAAFALVGMILSYTRSSWLVTTVILGGVSIWRRAALPLVALAVMTTVVAVVPARDDSREIAARARSSFDPVARSNQDRIARYRMGVAIVRDQPLLGLGPGGVIAEHARYAVPGVEGVSHLHNAFLQIAAERGLIGLAAWLVVVVGALGRALLAVRGADGERGALAGAVGLAILAFLMLGVFNYHWEDWRVRSLACLLIGAAWSPALTGVEATTSSPTTSMSPPQRRPSSAATG